MRIAIILITMLSGAAIGWAQSDEIPKVQTIPVRYALAVDVVKVLNEQYVEITFSAEQATNCIYGRIPKQQVQDIKKFVANMDDIARVMDPTESQIERLVQADRNVVEAKAQVSRYESKILSLEEDPQNLGVRKSEYMHYKSKAEEWGKYLEQVENVARTNANSKLDGLARAKPSSSANSEDLKSRLDDAKQKLVRLRPIFAKDHPQLLQVQQEIATYEQMLSESLKVHDGNQLHTATQSNNQYPIVATIQSEPGIRSLFARYTDSLTKQYERNERDGVLVAKRLRELKSALQKIDGDNSFEEKKRLQQEIMVGTDELKNLVSTNFDIRMQLQHAQLDEAETNLKASRERLVRRQQVVDKIVERRVNELLNGEETSSLEKHSTNGPPPKTLNETLHPKLPDLNR